MECNRYFGPPVEQVLSVRFYMLQGRKAFHVKHTSSMEIKVGLSKTQGTNSPLLREHHVSSVNRGVPFIENRKKSHGRLHRAVRISHPVDVRGLGCFPHLLCPITVAADLGICSASANRAQ